jgi:electron transfer flavoprotein alpha subunit
MADNKGILVYGEIVNGTISSGTTEVLGAGRRLADELKEELACVFISSELGDAAKKAIAYGADKVYTMAAPVKDYQNDMFVSIIEKLIKDKNPQIVLFCQSTVGRDLAPSLSFRLGSTVSMDCLEIKLNASKKLEFTRSVYGGNAQATFATNSLPQLATIRSKAMAPIAPDDARKGEIAEVKYEADASKVKIKVLETKKEEIAGVKLEDAAIVVSGGRGIGNKEGFQTLVELAKVLKAAVAASRPPCDNGWWPDTLQVGLTGKIVSPDVYIAVAISGASQHMAGCSGAKNIIAINKDAEANIFKFARYGIVGDWKVILPAFTEKVKQLVAS